MNGLEKAFKEKVDRLASAATESPPKPAQPDGNSAKQDAGRRGSEGSEGTPFGGLRNFTAAQLLRMEIEPPSYIVDGVLPEGVSLLAAAPKTGKTLLGLNVSVAVATGGRALGIADVEPGRVLYLYLEGSDAGLQNRLEALCEDGKGPDNLHLFRAFPSLSEGGLDALRAFRDKYSDLRLIVVDTLKRVRSRGNARRNAYDEDYETLQPLADFYKETGVSVLVIHHTNKSSSEDPMDLVSGSTGLTAAVDNVLVLLKKRGQMDAVLIVLPREQEEAELALSFDARISTWVLVGNAEDFAKTKERQEILDVLREAEGPLTVNEIHEGLGGQDSGKGKPALRKLLRKLQATDKVVKLEGERPHRYALPTSSSSTYSGVTQVTGVTPGTGVTGVTPAQDGDNSDLAEGRPNLSVTPVGEKGLHSKADPKAPYGPSEASFQGSITGVTRVTPGVPLRRGDQVETPAGSGEVLQVFKDRVTVHVGSEAMQFAPGEIGLSSQP